MVSFPKLSIAAIVLAGGKSSRMGTDKAEIAIGNVPLLHLICTVASKCASKIYIITPRTEKYLDLVPKSCHLLKEVSETEETKGPLVAFVQALTQIQTKAEGSIERWDTNGKKTEEWILLLACDLPLLNESVLLEWRNYLTTVPETTIALLPKSEKGWEPLCGFYRLSCLPLLEKYIQQGGRSFQGWLAKQSVRELPVSDRRVLFNCNTPEDLEKIGDFFSS
jgi:molybdopterin-guanine dinucleotide biosynthesis protein A